MAFNTLNQIIDKIQAQPSWQGRRHFLLILSNWKKVVGDRVAMETEPTGIYRNVLHVSVSNSSWSQALSFERRRILEKLQPLLVNYPPLEDIHFSTAKWMTNQKSRAIASKPQINSELFKNHPSYIPPSKLRSVDNKPHKVDPPQTAVEAFRRLTALVKKSTMHLPKCPKCHCPTPPGELERWHLCRICASQPIL